MTPWATQSFAFRTPSPSHRLWKIAEPRQSWSYSLNRSVSQSRTLRARSVKPVGRSLRTPPTRMYS